MLTHLPVLGLVIQEVSSGHQTQVDMSSISNIKLKVDRYRVYQDFSLSFSATKNNPDEYRGFVTTILHRCGGGNTGSDIEWFKSNRSLILTIEGKQTSRLKVDVYILLYKIIYLKVLKD